MAVHNFDKFNDMRKINDQETVHEILLNIAKVFHNICLENNIPYYMIGGTLLGAIRHRGFIPWDDDMDFGVPRDYFNILKTVLKKELQFPYKLLTFEESPALITDFIKISDDRTVVSEQYKEDIENFGFNIDIFPLDKSTLPNWRTNFCSSLLKLQGYRFLSYKRRPLLKKTVALFIKSALFWMKKDFIIKITNRMLISGKGNYMTNIYGSYGKREIVPTEYFGTPRLYDFEDTKLYGTEHPSEYLTAIYGNYMGLPPEDKRHFHIENAFWK